MAAKLLRFRGVNPPHGRSRTRLRSRSAFPQAERRFRRSWAVKGVSCPAPMLITAGRAALAAFGSLCTGRITGRITGTRSTRSTRTMAELSRDQVVFDQPKVGPPRGHVPAGF